MQNGTIGLKNRDANVASEVCNPNMKILGSDPTLYTSFRKEEPQISFG